MFKIISSHPTAKNLDLCLPSCIGPTSIHVTSDSIIFEPISFNVPTESSSKYFISPPSRATTNCRSFEIAWITFPVLDFHWFLFPSAFIWIPQDYSKVWKLNIFIQLWN